MSRTVWLAAVAVALWMGPAFSSEGAAEKQAEKPKTTAKDQAKKKAKKTRSTRTPDVVYVPTPHDAVEKMLEMAKVTKDDLVYDLGCGDGRIVVAAAKKYGCKAVGFDIDPRRVKEARENVKKNNVEHLVRIEEEDIFKLDLSPASVITLYLLPSLNVKLIPQLEKLKPGSRIVSHDFDMRGVKPDQEINYDSKEDNISHTLYLWTTPLKKDKKKSDDSDSFPF